PGGQDSAPLLKDILFRCHELGLQLRFTPISADSYEQWAAGQGQARHIITVLARRITAGHIARVAGIIAEFGLNIDRIDRLSGRMALGDAQPQDKACVEISARGPLNDGEFRARCMQLASELDIDVAYQEDNMFRRTRRLVCFDMDSTLIDAEVIDELAKRAGVGDQVAAIIERAMRRWRELTA